MLDTIIAIIVVLAVLGFVCGGMWLLERSDRKQDAIDQASQAKSRRETSDFFAAWRAKTDAARAVERAKKQRILASLHSKHWTDVRILCAAYNSCECMCATKEDAAESIRRGQMRLDKELGE